MADIDRKEVIQQIVALQKEYAEATRTLEFHYGPAKRENPLAPLWKTVDTMRTRQDLIDRRLRYIEKFVLSGSGGSAPQED
jgi:hypothetical protein